MLFPPSGLAGLDVVEYYLEVAPVRLPYLHGRPLTHHRFPGGAGEVGFFEKDAPGGAIPIHLPTRSRPRSPDADREERGYASTPGSSGPVRAGSYAASQNTDTVIPMASIVEMLVGLILIASVVVNCGLVVATAPLLRDSLVGRGTWKSALAIAVLFGLLSVLGTYAGFDFLGAKVNVRDLAPMIAGLIAGPFAGIGAGLIGGLQRLTLGGPSAVPCSIATVLAGLLGGAIYLWFGRRFAGATVAVVFAVLMECLHMLLVLLLVRPFSLAVELVDALAVPMIVANALGMASFAIIITDSLRRRQPELAAEGVATEEPGGAPVA